MIGKISVKNKLIFSKRGLGSSYSACFGLRELEYMREERTACICIEEESISTCVVCVCI